MVFGTAAWACTPQAALFPPVPLEGPKGTPVLIRGQAPSPGPVQVRWNSLTGPVIATTEAGEGHFAIQNVAIPDVPAGVYYMVLTTETNEVARVGFEVTRAPGEDAKISSPVEVSEQLWDTKAKPERPDHRNIVALSGALLAIGLVVLAAGLFVVVTRGTRVPAGRRHRSR